MAAPDIFLSYNREDVAVAKLYADSFAREGLEVWWDVTLRSGEHIAILRQLWDETAPGA